MRVSRTRSEWAQCFAALIVLFSTLTSAGADSDEFARWEKDIRAFDQSDATNPPAKHGVLFVGSSSIRKWDLDKSFPGKHYINRGFGGSHIADSVHFADRLILRHEPRVVVFFAGGNDLAAGKTPQRVFDDFRALVKVIHGKLPQTQIVFISIKPSIARWKLVEQVRATNALVQEFCARDKQLDYINAFTPMIGKDGKPRPELFVKDGEHLNDAGYALWTSILKPHLDAVKN